MITAEILRNETILYQDWAERLKAEFGDLDDETLADTLEGLSSLPEMVEELIRSGLDDEALGTGLKNRITDMSTRLERFQTRARRKRELACKAMIAVNLKTVRAPDFTAGLRQGAQRLAVSDEARIPERFQVPQPPRLDRQSLAAALKCGETVEGACLEAGSPHISVRTK